MTDKPKFDNRRQGVPLIALQLWASRKLGEFHGMFGPLRKLRERMGIVTTIVHDENIAGREECVEVLASPEANIYQKIAASMLLDYYDPKWRETYPREVVGAIVMRRDREVAVWRRSVIEKDGGKCRLCGSSDKLHAHHILRWIDFPSERLLLHNGACLCQRCHADVHTGRRQLM